MLSWGGTVPRLSLAIVFVQLFLITTSSPSNAEKRVALVIGNSSYLAAGQLANPKNDAADLAKALKALSFEVVEALDVNKADMDRKVRDFATALSGASVGLFFYAGHGLQVSGANYLVPVDAQLSTASALDFEMVRLDLIQRTMEREAKTNILFLDACRDNPLARNLARAMGTRSTEIGRGLAAAESGVGTLISFSTQPGNVALDGSGRNSPFAGALLNHIDKPGEDLMSVLIGVRSDVMQATNNKQVPWEHSAMTGRFYFRSAEPGVGSVTAPPSPLPQTGPAAATMSEAAQSWSMIQSSTDPSVFAAYRKQYGADNPFYDQLAAGRISMLQQQTEKPSSQSPGPLAAPKSDKRPAAPVSPSGGSSRSAEWASPGGNLAGHRYSELAAINKENVSNLRVAWSFSTGVLRGHEGSPLVIGDTMYVVTPFPNNVFALDLENQGEVKWKYAPRQDPSTIPVMCCDTVNRGVFYDDERIFLHQADTTLVALDARTGKELWKVVNGDVRKAETGTSAPIVARNKVIVGISGGEFGVRGHITAYDASNGKRAWRAYSVGPDSDILVDPIKTISLGRPVGKNSSLKTWTGDQWKTGGGTTWGWISYDPDLNLIYYGSSNPSTWNPTQRAGPDGKPIDQKWTDSIFARDPDTGMATWIYQMTPFDEWSYDGVNEMILADIEVESTPHKTLVHLDKSGLAYTLDRQTGEPLVAEKFDPAVNWTTGVELDKSKPDYGRPQVVASRSPFLNGADVNTNDICPSSAGAKNQGPAAFSPKSGLIYASTSRLCMDYEPFKVSYTPGQPFVGAVISMYPPQGETNRGSFIAWDAAQGKVVWKKDESFAVWSGALATAGDVVFYGTLDGFFKAVDAATGDELFKYKTASGIIGNPITYTLKGKQYVAVLSGVGGWAGIALAAGLTKPTDGLGMTGAHAGLEKHTALGGQVVVFALP